MRHPKSPQPPPEEPLPEDLSVFRARFQTAITAALAQEREEHAREVRACKPGLLRSWTEKAANGVTAASYTSAIYRDAAQELADAIGLKTSLMPDGRLTVTLGEDETT